MREIKFRGKSRKNFIGICRENDWVYGDILQLKTGKVYIIHHLSSYEDPVFIEVDPETVGEYIYRIDKNGQEIYEGDIVELYTPAEGIIGRYIVRWDEVAARFYLEGNWKIDPDEIWEHSQSWLTVIGNIYDNPELLQEASK